MAKLQKRGRPKGSKNKSTILKEQQELLNKKEIEPPKIIPKAFKHLGFCKCGALIGSVDLCTEYKYVCPHCHKQDKVSKLNKKNKSEIYTSKKDYMDHVVNAEVIASLPLSDDLDLKDVRVKNE